MLQGIKKETHDLSLQEFCLKLESVVERSDATREAKVLALPICQGDGDDLCRDMCLEILQAPLIRGPSHSEDKAEQKAQHHFGPNITFGKNVWYVFSTLNIAGLACRPLPPPAHARHPCTHTRISDLPAATVWTIGGTVLGNGTVLKRHLSTPN